MSAPACMRRRRRIILLPKTLGTNFWDYLRAGARAESARRGMDLIAHAPEAESDYGNQAAMLEAAIRERPDGIILAPSHGSVMASGIRHAHSVGIPVVLVESSAMVGPEEYLGFVGSNEEAMGTIAASRVGEILKGEGEIAILGVSPTTETTTVRERTFAKVVGERFPRIRIADIRYGLGEHMRSFEVVADLLTAHPQMDALFSSDAMGTRGAHAALRATPGVRLVGVAGELDLLRNLANGLIDSLVIQSPRAMGKLAVGMIHDYLEDRRIPNRRIETEVALATRENVRSEEIRRILGQS